MNGTHVLSWSMGWGDLVMGAIGSVKDSGASAAIKSWLARELADYGEVQDFKMNSRDRSAELHILLKGEREKLTVNIDEYEGNIHSEKWQVPMSLRVIEPEAAIKINPK